MSNEQMNEVLRDLLLRLERVQREVGEVQSELVRLLQAERGQPSTPSGSSPPAVPVEEVAEPVEEAKAPPTTALADPLLACIHPTEWLANRGVTVLRQPPPSELDGAFDRLATFLGERFQNIRPFYEAIKRRVGGVPYPGVVQLTDAPPHVISDICQFGKLLHDHGFLSLCHYRRNTRTLSFEPQADGRVTNFFTGDWLERYVLLSVLERAGALLPEGVEPIVLTKAVVSLPDNQETELDILLGLPDRVLWLECKTGDWQEHAAKFGRIARHLNVPRQHAALVLLESLDPVQKKTASALSGMIAVNPEELEGFIEAAITHTA